MYVYLNAEYTSTNCDAKLISLGLVAQTGQKLYLEFIDVPKYLITSYASNEVLPETFIYGSDTIEEGLKVGNQVSKSEGYTYQALYEGQAAAVITSWFLSLLANCEKGEKVQLVSYCCHYDAVLFYNLFRGDIPTQILNPYCYDIFHEVMVYVNFLNRTAPLQEKIESALTCNFRQFASDYFKVDIDYTAYYNALHYAEIIKGVFNRIYNH